MIEGLRSAAGKQPGNSEDVAHVLQRSPRRCEERGSVRAIVPEQ